MATYPPRRLLGARPLPSDPRRDPRRSGFTQSGGGSPRKLRCSCTHFQGPAARHHHLLRSEFPAAETVGCVDPIRETFDSETPHEPEWQDAWIVVLFCARYGIPRGKDEMKRQNTESEYLQLT